MLETIDLEKVAGIAKEAGDAIMEIYARDFGIDYKDDKSPLTEADTKSNEIICDALQKLYPQIPILSEENKAEDYAVRRQWEYFWCIDPIDGTKEFIRKNGEFTVNIALIYKDTPVLGIVYAPALGEMYFAKKGSGAYKMPIDGQRSTIDGLKKAMRLPIDRQIKENELIVVASKSHLSPETEQFINSLRTDDQRLTTISKGSSLKLVMVAEGSADIYPRLAPTMEWDTAAADAIVREAGKMTFQFVPESESESPLIYNKPNLLNPWFVVR